MRKVAFFIDGWFMRKRIYSLKSFFYDGPNIRKYCCRHLQKGDYLYRIFYYDTEPLDARGHNPITKRSINFKNFSVFQQQNDLFTSIKNTPNFALRKGRSIWPNSSWTLNWDRTKELLNKKISVDDLEEGDVKPNFIQKTVDMKLGLDIATVSIKKLADMLVIITGDEDIVPALKLARTEGMQVCLDPLWKPVSDDLKEHIDFLSTKTNKPDRKQKGRS